MVLQIYKMYVMLDLVFIIILGLFLQIIIYDMVILITKVLKFPSCLPNPLSYLDRLNLTHKVM